MFHCHLQYTRTVQYGIVRFWEKQEKIDESVGGPRDAGGGNRSGEREEVGKDKTEMICCRAEERRGRARTQMGHDEHDRSLPPFPLTHPGSATRCLRSGMVRYVQTSNRVATTNSDVVLRCSTTSSAHIQVVNVMRCERASGHADESGLPCSQVSNDDRYKRSDTTRSAVGSHRGEPQQGAGELARLSLEKTGK